ncbi:MAG: hypothetical protein WBL61_10055 [Bryobacteraceae bacterium]
MSNPAPESGSADPLYDDYGEEETGDLNAADQTVRRGRRTLRGSGGLRLRSALARHLLAEQLAVEIAACASLESPGVR